jgi:arylsulfatase A-like enzyme
MMPTLADAVGVASPSGLDGLSFMPTLLGEPDQAEHADLYWEYHGLWNGAQAVRSGRWKGVRLGGHDDAGAPVQLYDLDDDPAERTDVAEQHPEVVERVLAVMESRTESRVARWNFARR